MNIPLSWMFDVLKYLDNRATILKRDDISFDIYI